MEGEKKIKENEIKAEVVEIVNKAKASANKQNKETDEKANVALISIESNLQASKAKYKALLEEGKAEAKNLEAFEA